VFSRTTALSSLGYGSGEMRNVKTSGLKSIGMNFADEQQRVADEQARYKCSSSLGKDVLSEKLGALQLMMGAKKSVGTGEGVSKSLSQILSNVPTMRK
jgi:hypothetical protein